MSMFSACRSSLKGVPKALLSLLLAVQAISSLMNNPAMNAYSDDGVNYASFHSVAEVRAAAERSIAKAKSAAMDVLLPGSTLPADANELIARNAPVTNGAPIVSGAETAKVVERSSAAAKAMPPDDAPMVVKLADQSLDAESLDGIRGGFELDNGGLKYSFGIERAVYINGELVAHTTLNIKELQSTAGAGGALQQPAASAAAGALGVIQNGGGNTVAAQPGSNLAGTVIQNTLNNQKIQNVTTINAAVNSSQILRAMSVQSAVQQGIVSSLRR